MSYTNMFKNLYKKETDYGDYSPLSGFSNQDYSIGTDPYQDTMQQYASYNRDIKDNSSLFSPISVGTMTDIPTKPKNPFEKLGTEPNVDFFTNQDIYQTIRNMKANGIEPVKEENKVGGLSRVLNILSSLGNAVTSGVYTGLEGLDETMKKPTMSVGEASKNALSKTLDVYSSALKGFTNSFSGDRDKVEQIKTGSDIVEKLFGTPTSTLGKVGKGVGGFALDVLLDPTTYVTFGASSVVKGGAKGVAKKLGAETLEKVGAEGIEKSIGNTVKEANKLVDGMKLGDKAIYETKDIADNIFKNIDSKVNPKNTGFSIGLPFGKQTEVISGDSIAKMSEKFGLNKPYKAFLNIMDNSEIGKALGNTGNKFTDLFRTTDNVAIREALKVGDIDKASKLMAQQKVSPVLNYYKMENLKKASDMLKTFNKDLQDSGMTGEQLTKIIEDMKDINFDNVEDLVHYNENSIRRVMGTTEVEQYKPILNKAIGIMQDLRKIEVESGVQVGDLGKTYVPHIKTEEYKNLTKDVADENLYKQYDEFGKKGFEYGREELDTIENINKRIKEEYGVDKYHTDYSKILTKRLYDHNQALYSNAVKRVFVENVGTALKGKEALSKAYGGVKNNLGKIIRVGSDTDDITNLEDILNGTFDEIDMKDLAKQIKDSKGVLKDKTKRIKDRHKAEKTNVIKEQKDVAKEIRKLDDEYYNGYKVQQDEVDKGLKATNNKLGDLIKDESGFKKYLQKNYDTEFEEKVKTQKAELKQLEKDTKNAIDDLGKIHNGDEAFDIKNKKQTESEAKQILSEANKKSVKKNKGYDNQIIGATKERNAKVKERTSLEKKIEPKQNTYTRLKKEKAFYEKRAKERRNAFILNKPNLTEKGKKKAINEIEADLYRVKLREHNLVYVKDDLDKLSAEYRNVLDNISEIDGNISNLNKAKEKYNENVAKSVKERLTGARHNGAKRKRAYTKQKFADNEHLTKRLADLVNEKESMLKRHEDELNAIGDKYEGKFDNINGRVNAYKSTLNGDYENGNPLFNNKIQGLLDKRENLKADYEKGRGFNLNDKLTEYYELEKKKGLLEKRLPLDKRIIRGTTEEVSEVNRLNDIKSKYAKDSSARKEVKNEIKQGRAYYLSNEDLKIYKEMMGEQVKKDGVEFLKLYDKITNIWKEMALLTPSFHAKNKFDNNFRMFLELGADIGNPKWGKMANDIMNGETGTLVTKSGKRYSYAEIKKAMEVLSVYGAETNQIVGEFNKFTKGVGTLEDFVKSVENGTEYSGRLGKVGEFSHNLGNNIENNDKRRTFLIALFQGKSPLEAKKIVDDTLFDYSKLSSFERDFLKRAMPFYTFMRKNGEYQLRKFIESPNTFKNVKRATDNEKEAFLTEDEKKTLTSADDKKIVFTNPITGEKQLLNTNISLMDIPNPIASLNPLVKTPIELYTNKNMTYGGNIENYNGEVKKGNALENLVGGMLGKTQKGKDGTYIDKKTSYALNSLIPLLRTIDTKGTKNVKETLKDKDIIKLLTTASGFNGGDYAQDRRVTSKLLAYKEQLDNQKSNLKKRGLDVDENYNLLMELIKKQVNKDLFKPIR